MKKLLLILLLLSMVFNSCSTVEPATIGKSTEDPVYVSYPTISVNFTDVNIEIEHSSSHEFEGADVITVEDLQGVLANDQHVLDTEVISGIENAIGMTLPALTMGGNILTNAKAFDAGSGTVNIISTAPGGSLKLTNTVDGVYGVYLETNHISASPGINDVIFAFANKAENSVGGTHQYTWITYRIADYQDGTEDGIIQWYISENGTLNECMKLESDGTLYIDASYEIFDDYEDAQLLKEALKNNKPELFEQAGIYLKKFKLDVNGNKTDIPDGYMVDIQSMMKLNSGGIYQLLDYMQNLETRIIELEKLIK